MGFLSLFGSQCFGFLPQSPSPLWLDALPCLGAAAASSGETSRYGVLLVYKKKAVGAYLLERPSGVVVGLKDMQAAMAEAEAQQTSGEDYSGDWGERHDEELTDEAQQTSGEDYSGDWGERHDEELDAQQTSGEPDAAPQAVPYTELPLDAEGYPVE